MSSPEHTTGLANDQLAISLKPFLRVLGTQYDEKGDVGKRKGNSPFKDDSSPEIEDSPTTASKQTVPDRLRIACISMNRYGLICCGTESGDLVLLDAGGKILQYLVNVHKGAVMSVALDHELDHQGRWYIVSIGRLDNMLISNHTMMISEMMGLSFPNLSKAVLTAQQSDPRSWPRVENRGTYQHFVGMSTGPTCLALEPLMTASAYRSMPKSDSGSKSQPRVCYAGLDGRVVIHTRGWFGGKDTVLRSGEGAVYSVSWQGPLLAWVTDFKVRVFDMMTEKGICVVDAPGRPDLRSLALNYASASETTTSAQASAYEQEGEWDKGPLSGQLAEILQYSEDNITDDFRNILHPKLIWNPTSSTVDQSSSSHELTMIWPNAVKVLKLVWKHDLKKFEPFGLDTYSDTCLKSGSGDESRLIYFVDAVPFTSELLLTLCLESKMGFALSAISTSSKKAIYSETVPLSQSLPSRARLTLFFKLEGEPEVLCWCGSGQVPINEYHSVWRIQVPTAEERVRWLEKNQRYMEAFSIAEYAALGMLESSSKIRIAHVGEKLLQQLRSKGKFEELAVTIPRVVASYGYEQQIKANPQAKGGSSSLGIQPSAMGSLSSSKQTKDEKAVAVVKKQRWMYWAQVFTQAHSLHLLISYIPVEELEFTETECTQLLLDLLQESPRSVATMVKSWPRTLISLTPLIRRVEQMLRVENQPPAEESSVLSELCMSLYSLTGRHDETLAFLIRDSNEDVFKHIRTHNMYTAVQNRDMVSQLFTMNLHLAISLFTQAPSTVVAPDDLIRMLIEIGNEDWLFEYLQECFRMNPTLISSHHEFFLEMLCKRYAAGIGDAEQNLVQLTGSAILNFLQESQSYSLDFALAELNKYKGSTVDTSLGRERVYVLTRMGDLRSAMSILLDELNDVPAALEFTQVHSDPILYEKLLQRAETNDDILGSLLDHSYGQIDPIALINMLRPERNIPNLRDRLLRLISECNQEKILRESSAMLLLMDAELYAEEFEKLIRM